MYYYDKLVPNTWSERGNGWKIDNDVSIICYNKTIIPKFHCGCERYALICIFLFHALSLMT